jgi:hypothetical protein
METKFKVGDRVRAKDKNEPNRRGIVESICDWDIAVTYDPPHPEYNYFFAKSDSMELDPESQEPPKTQLDTQPETLWDRFAMRVFSALQVPHHPTPEQIKYFTELAYTYAAGMLKAREAE